MGRVRRRPSRKPDRPHRDRSPEGYRLVHRRRMDRYRHLVSKAETKSSVHYSHCIHSDTSYRINLRGDLEKAEEGGRRADQVTT